MMLTWQILNDIISLLLKKTCFLTLVSIYLTRLLSKTLKSKLNLSFSKSKQVVEVGVFIILKHFSSSIYKVAIVINLLTANFHDSRLKETKEILVTYNSLESFVYQNMYQFIYMSILATVSPNCFNIKDFFKVSRDYININFNFIRSGFLEKNGSCRPNRETDEDRHHITLIE